MDGCQVKQEILEPLINNNGDSSKRKNVSEIPVIDLDSSDDDSSTSANAVSNGKRTRVSSDGGGDEVNGGKKKKSGDGVVLPAGFLDPLPPKDVASRHANGGTGMEAQSCKQFWKAGDFEQGAGGNWDTSSGGMDHVRVHPRFLHSNATSHKWVLGAFAELLDNSLDEVCNGATYVKIDMLTNKKVGNRMLLIEDNGGGMDPDKMRRCMSLGYSLKSKVADTIGQYGNGFKTSTMRLGADVIVFSRCSAKDGKRSTQSIGLLSYTFLRSTGKEDIVVPMLDYERGVREWKKMIRSSASDWDRNVKAVVQWSPFSSEEDLLRQFDHMKDQGTRIIIYNLWEDDQGQLELDFDADKDDIQIRGVNRDEKSIQMAKQFPNSRHFLTYRHSLRSYSSILYLRIPPGFRMILRGKDVEHHNIVNDMMMMTEVTYRPQPGADGVSKDSNIVAIVTMGFVKDAKAHIDVQGYNVYHKNRLIKPFWRLWNAAGSDGRGVIGVLEANFVEPAHDKQGFERTIVLSRLESRLIQMQKTYWRTYCHKIGYAPRRNRSNLEDRESSPDYSPETSSRKKKAASSKAPLSNKSSLPKHQKLGGSNSSRHPTPAVNGNGYDNNIKEKGNNSHRKSGEGPSSLRSTPSAENICDDDLQTTMHMRHTNSNSHKEISAKKSSSKDGSHSVSLGRHAHSEPEQDCSPNGETTQIVKSSSKDGSHSVLSARHAAHSGPEQDCSPNGKTTQIVKSSSKDGSHSVRSARHAAHSEPEQDCSPNGKTLQIVTRSQSRFPSVVDNETAPSNCSTPDLDQLMEENRELKKKLKRKEEEILGELLHDLESERNRCKSLEAQLEEAKQKCEILNKEQDNIIDIFAEERERRDLEEENLRKKLKEATATIQELVERVRRLEIEKMKTRSHKRSPA